LPTNSLREKARAAAAPTLPDDRPEGIPAEPATVRRPPDNNTASEPLEDIEYTGEITDAAQVPVHVALARVMADVQSVRKDDNRNDVGGRYNFRGVDRVVNAVGPALRRHGVLVIPVRVFDVEYRETRTKSGTVMEDCTLKVEWAVIGPKGDALPACLQSTGQANDTSDKATAKAMSVAQRVLFLASLHVPTQDPTVDLGHDRGEQPRPEPNGYRDEAVNPGTTLGRLRQMRTEVARHGLASVLVVNGEGDEEPLLTLIDRIGKERQGGSS
jgi:hypothetical protein